jgi:hypothetical protein
MDELAIRAIVGDDSGVAVMFLQLLSSNRQSERVRVMLHVKRFEDSGQIGVERPQAT